jgi:peptidoglycan/LPS O-acetylase OafA/YrhL
MPGVDPPALPRNRSFDILRIIFATLVLCAHAAELTDGNRSREIFARLSRSPMTFGDVGVVGFFLLSGYLIVRSWQGDPEFLNFLQKRMLRIAPGYFVALPLGVIVVGLLAPAVPGFFPQLFNNLLHHAKHILPPILPGNPYPRSTAVFGVSRQNSGAICLWGFSGFAEWCGGRSNGLL